MTIMGKLIGEEKADIVVIGSGIVGISSAYHLERAGFNVIGLEESEIASGATQYSSGVLYFGSGTDFQTAISLWGHEKARAFFDETKKSIDEMVELVKQNNLEVGLHSPGAMIVARNEEEKKYLESESKAMEGLGYAGTLLTSAETEKHYAGATFTAGLNQPIGHQIKPGLFAQQLAKILSARFYEESGMIEIAETHGGIQVKTSEGSVHAKHVVVATNLKPFYGLEEHFFMENSSIITTDPLGDKIKELWPQDKIIWTPDEKYDILYTHDQQAFLEVYEPKNIEEKIRRYFPEDVVFKKNKMTGDSWAKTHDWLPIVGTIKPGIHVAIAMGDQGIVMGYTAGRNMPLLIQGTDSLFLNMTNPKRFKN